MDSFLIHCSGSTVCITPVTVSMFSGSCLLVELWGFFFLCYKGQMTKGTGAHSKNSEMKAWLAKQMRQISQGCSARKAWRKLSSHGKDLSFILTSLKKKSLLVWKPHQNNYKTRNLGFHVYVSQRPAEGSMLDASVSWVKQFDLTQSLPHTIHIFPMRKRESRKDKQPGQYYSETSKAGSEANPLLLFQRKKSVLYKAAGDRDGQRLEEHVNRGVQH